MTAYQTEKELQNISRTLKEISSTLKDQNRLLKTMAQNYLEVHKKPNEDLLPPLKNDDPIEVPPNETKEPVKVYGWSMASLHQREGTLNIGDIMVEMDESHWIWVGQNWERIESPSEGT